MTDLYAGPLSLLSLLGINTVISLFNIKLFPNQATRKWEKEETRDRFSSTEINGTCRSMTEESLVLSIFFPSFSSKSSSLFLHETRFPLFVYSLYSISSASFSFFHQTFFLFCCLIFVSISLFRKEIILNTRQTDLFIFFHFHRIFFFQKFYFFQKSFPSINTMITNFFKLKQRDKKSPKT